MVESHVEISKGGTAFVGPDAVLLVKAIYLKNCLILHRRSGILPTRSVTVTKLFDLASQYTGKKYKRGEHLRAIEDMGVWIATMQAALPINERGEK